MRFFGVRCIPLASAQRLAACATSDAEYDQIFNATIVPFGDEWDCPAQTAIFYEIHTFPVGLRKSGINATLRN